MSPATAASASIEIRAVRKLFGSGADEVHAFGPSDLHVAPGEFVSLLGPSGCGKSTLMLMIAGLLERTDGEIFVDGELVDAPRTDVGIMFQDSTLVPWRSVRGNVELQLELRGLDVSAYRDRIDDLLHSVHLDGFEDRSPYELSGGMQQRAALCQAIVHEPGTLLLDEPLGKLDAMTRERIRADLQDLWMRRRPDGGVRHAQHRGGDSALDENLRDHAAAGADRPCDRHRPALAARARREARRSLRVPSGEDSGDLSWLRRALSCRPRPAASIGHGRAASMQGAECPSFPVTQGFGRCLVATAVR